MERRCGMISNKMVLFCTLLLFSTKLFSGQHFLNKKVEYIYFNQISLQNLMGFLNNEYGVNFDLHPTLKNRIVSVQMRDTTLQSLVESLALQNDMVYENYGDTFYFMPKEEFLYKKFIQGDMHYDKKEIRYASLSDVMKFINDMMPAQTVIRSSTENKIYDNLYDAHPSLQIPGVDGGSSDKTVYPNINISPNQGLAPDAILYLIPFYNENMLYFISSSRSLIEKAKKLVYEVDKPIKQVLIQGEIIELTLGDGLKSVFDFSMAGKNTQLGQNTASTVTFGNLQYTFLDKDILSNIEIAKNEGRASFVSSPMLLTLNRSTATLDLTEEISIVTGIKEGSTTTNEGTSVVIPPTPIYEKQKVGTQLKITPFINKNNEILLKIDIDIASVSGNTQTIIVPLANGGTTEYKTDSISRYSVNTVLTVANEKSIVLGGLIRESVSKSEKKTPILGHIPLLGIPFRQINNQREKKELVIILTPKIIDLQEPKADVVEFAIKEQVRENLERREEEFLQRHRDDFFKKPFQECLKETE